MLAAAAAGCDGVENEPTPNVLTLGIVLGTGSGSHAGDRTLDVEAPAFRGATLIGALVAAGLIVGAWYLVASRRRAWRRVEQREIAGEERLE